MNRHGDPRTDATYLGVARRPRILHAVALLGTEKVDAKSFVPVATNWLFGMLVEIDDWVEIEPAEARVYADAVARRHFADMRRARYAMAGRNVPRRSSPSGSYASRRRRTSPDGPCGRRSRRCCTT
jgi:hypothetical protein